MEYGIFEKNIWNGEYLKKISAEYGILCDFIDLNKEYSSKNNSASTPETRRD